MPNARAGFGVVAAIAAARVAAANALLEVGTTEDKPPAASPGAAEHLTSQEATRLIRLCHAFYADDALFAKFVKPFNHAQSKFDFDALVAETAKRTWSDDIIQ